MSSRRELTTAVLAAAVAGGLALFASGQRWADDERASAPAAAQPPIASAISRRRLT